ncbi:MAG: 5'-methylthioadenosine/S-adenosylhomocysteine nucleosidase, partial [Desulfobaccales bacterium]|nr:5'-methylthioadenosine/S-adenosylhomocysteine nucleosidase [Desulfobaccales bacterium]
MPSNLDQPRRAVILTALRVEYLAVRAHLTDPKQHTHPQGTVYEKGNFPSPAGQWEVLVAEIGQGNPDAAFETERAINYFQPDAALFVGVAGGLKDVSLGDVVAASWVRGYERGKVTGQEFQLREYPGKSSHRMVQRAMAEAKKADWLSRLTGPAPLPSPKVLVEPIASGEKVVASKRSALYRFLRSACSDAVAVEMEGIGFLAAAHAHPQVYALVVRGISDLIAGKNAPDEEERQQTASRHAAAFAFEVLAKFDLPGRKREPGRKPVWNIPHRQNPNFTGRQELLDDLHRALTSGRPAALTQAIHGLGGVGKTGLAVEYAYRHGPEYSLVWWLRSEEPVALAA